MDRTDRIVPLDELKDYKVADRDPDVRGWDVFDVRGEKIGEVDRLLVDTATLKVRYLDVDLDDGIATGDRHVLVPIGYARLDEREDHVFVDRITAAQLASVPAYVNEPLTREYEDELRSHFDSQAPRAIETQPDFYAHESYDDTRFYGARRAPLEGSSDRPILSDARPEVGRYESTLDRPIETPLSSEYDRVRGEDLGTDAQYIAGDELASRHGEALDQEMIDADLRGERGDVLREGTPDPDSERY